MQESQSFFFKPAKETELAFKKSTLLIPNQIYIVAYNSMERAIIGLKLF